MGEPTQILAQQQEPSSSPDVSGNKIFCRFRPFIKADLQVKLAPGQQGVVFDNTGKPKSSAAFHKNGKNCLVKYGVDRPVEFSFDGVFNMNATQIAVFRETAMPLLTHVLNGTNGTLICFGGRKSGTSYTALGAHDDFFEVFEHKGDGIIPRTIRAIFPLILSMEESLEFTIRFSCFEISETDKTVHDLLEGPKSRPKHVEIVIDPETSKRVLRFDPPLVEEYVISDTELFSLLTSAVGKRNYRVVGGSREYSSSLFFELTFTKRHLVSGERTVSRISIVDFHFQSAEMEMLEPLFCPDPESPPTGALGVVLLGRIDSCICHFIAHCSPHILEAQRSVRVLSVARSFQLSDAPPLEGPSQASLGSELSPTLEPAKLPLEIVPPVSEKEAQQQAVDEKIQMLENELEHSRSSEEALVGRIAEYERELSAAREVASQSRNESEAFKAEQVSLRFRLQEHESKLLERNLQIEQHQTTNAEQRLRLDELQQRLAEKDAQIQLQEATIKEQQRRLEEQQKQLTEQDERFTALQNQRQPLFSSTGDSSTLIGEVGFAVKYINNQISELRTAHSDLYKDMLSTINMYSQSQEEFIEQILSKISQLSETSGTPQPVIRPQASDSQTSTEDLLDETLTSALKEKASRILALETKQTELTETLEQAQRENEESKKLREQAREVAQAMATIQTTYEQLVQKLQQSRDEGFRIVDEKLAEVALKVESVSKGPRTTEPPKTEHSDAQTQTQAQTTHTEISETPSSQISVVDPDLVVNQEVKSHDTDEKERPAETRTEINAPSLLMQAEIEALRDKMTVLENINYRMLSNVPVPKEEENILLCEDAFVPPEIPTQPVHDPSRSISLESVAIQTETIPDGPANKPDSAAFESRISEMEKQLQSKEQQIETLTSSLREAQEDLESAKKLAFLIQPPNGAPGLSDLKRSQSVMTRAETKTGDVPDSEPKTQTTPPSPPQPITPAAATTTFPSQPQSPSSAQSESPPSTPVQAAQKSDAKRAAPPPPEQTKPGTPQGRKLPPVPAVAAATSSPSTGQAESASDQAQTSKSQPPAEQDAAATAGDQPKARAAIVRPTAPARKNAPAIQRVADLVEDNDTAESKSGFLLKEGKNVKSWKRRWCAIHGDRFEYYSNVGDKRPINAIVLQDARVTESKEKETANRQFVFVIKTHSRLMYLCASSDDERYEWMAALNRVVMRLNRQSS